MKHNTQSELNTGFNIWGRKAEIFLRQVIPNNNTKIIILIWWDNAELALSLIFGDVFLSI